MTTPSVQRIRPFGQAQYVGYGCALLFCAQFVLAGLWWLVAHRGDLGAIIRSFGASGGSPFHLFQLTVIIPLLLLVGLADGILTVLEISDAGIAWKRWGRTRWLISWSDFTGWRWQQRPGERGRRGLLLLEGNEDKLTTRRVSLLWHPIDADPFYRSILAALEKRAPEKGERPSPEANAALAESEKANEARLVWILVFPGTVVALLLMLWLGGYL